MRFVAFFARHPRLRNGLVFLAVAAVLLGGVRLWTSVPPDAVHVTITHLVLDERMRPVTTRVTTDRTIHNSAVAQRLQRDLAALPLNDPFDPFVAFSCPTGPNGGHTYDAYTLTWYRAGLPIEQASVTDTGCAIWQDDGVFFHRPYGAQVLYADIDAALSASN